MPDKNCSFQKGTLSKTLFPLFNCSSQQITFLQTSWKWYWLASIHSKATFWREATNLLTMLTNVILICQTQLSNNLLKCLYPSVAWLKAQEDKIDRHRCNSLWKAYLDIKGFSRVTLKWKGDWWYFFESKTFPESFLFKELLRNTFPKKVLLKDLDGLDIKGQRVT